MFSRFTNTTTTYINTLAGRKDHVDKADGSEFIKDATWLVSQSGRSGHLIETLPQDIR